ncbi:MAG: glutamine cyclotransferase [Halieaceae bacterium]|jgi:glutamine cyclotransferase
MKVRSALGTGLRDAACLLSLLLGLALCAAAGAVERYGYTVLEKRPQARQNFVQGLQIFDGKLYVGTGKYGQSRLLEYDFASMNLLREVQLPPTLFGEGVTRMQDRIFQLTWRSGRLLVHDADTFRLLRVVPIGTQGWGITHNGTQLIYSDGSHLLYFLDPDTLAQERVLSVSINGQPLPRLNELEWIAGEIWANVWQTEQLVRIDADSGEVIAVIDLSDLLDPAERQPDTDVLNGIAWDAAEQALWVTGKSWPWLYRIQLEPPGAAVDAGASTDKSEPQEGF